MITPGQKLIYKKDDHTLTVENLTDLAPETEWIDGRLVFRNTSLDELEKKLERWFDVEIEFADETVKGRRFSGTLERESILEVISYFGISQYVDYNIKGNVITFFSENNRNN
jgi:ferric-dicitrate binding protein FerR (iron transport regulator)